MNWESVREIVAAFFILGGAFVTFSAALGVARFPDAFTRMHAATKAGVVGAGSLMLGCSLAVGTWPAVLSALVGVFFLVSTVALSAHALGRAAYLSGAPLAENTVANALENVYPRPSHDRLLGVPAAILPETAPSDGACAVDMEGAGAPRDMRT